MTNANQTDTAPQVSRIMSALDRHPACWLAVGALLLVASQARFSVGSLAWFAAAPWLRYLRVTSGVRSRAVFVAASLAAWTLVFAKIVTEPLPLAIAPLFSLPIGLILCVPYLLSTHLRRRGEGFAVLAFAAAMVVGEWCLHGLLPFGTWGSAANTQLEQLALLQWASVAGIHGVSFLVYAMGAALEAAHWDRSRAGWRRVGLATAAVVALVALGEARLALSTGSGAPRTLVAAVGTDSTVGRGPLPSEADEREVQHRLFERTRRAAAAGARLVVWTEAATMVRPDQETAFQDRVAALAGELEVLVVAGYVVPLSGKPLRYRNRYALLGPDGTLKHVYDKHRPVPGEPAIAGTAPMPYHDDPEVGRIAGAVCYDYDFPRLALEHAALGADIVALPSSDWRGIDPIHTQMAALRAIEGGHSVVRSTRFGLSAAFDPHGRPRGWLSHFDTDDRILLASVPRDGVRTVYGVLGDWFPLACAVLLLWPFASRVGRWYARRPWRTPSSASPVAPSSTRASDSTSTSVAS